MYINVPLPLIIGFTLLLSSLEQVNEFLGVLEWDLSRGVSGRTDSLLSQSMYFGLSFSRIGADFRPLIVPVFVRVTVDAYQRALRTAKHRYNSVSLSLL